MDWNESKLNLWSNGYERWITNRIYRYIESIMDRTYYGVWSKAVEIWPNLGGGGGGYFNRVAIDLSVLEREK